MSYRSRPVVIAERQVALGGREIRCIVKRSSAARRVRFEIRDGGVLTVVLPRACRLDSLEEMVQSKARWILRHIDALAAVTRPAGKRRLRAGDTVPYLGRDVRIETPAGDGGRLMAELQGETLTVCGGSARYPLEVVAKAWYRIEARRLLGRKADKYAAALGVACRRCTIREQKTRWGSCSSKGTLSFNWRIIMAPEAVVDYVVLHEVAHLREMNHTRRFWRLVAERCPSWREHRKWLNDHGAELAAVLSAPRRAEEGPR